YYDRASAFGEHWFYTGQRGEAYSYAERIGISNRDLDAAFRLRPNFPRAYYMRGFNEYSAGQYGNAVKYWDIALSSTPQEAKILNLRGDANLRLGHADRAYRDFAKAVELD